MGVRPDVSVGDFELGPEELGDVSECFFARGEAFLVVVQALQANDIEIGLAGQRAFLPDAGVIAARARVLQQTKDVVGAGDAHSPS